MQKLSQLKDLVLNLSDNNLGNDELNMGYLGDILKNMINLKKLELSLCNNNLG